MIIEDNASFCEAFLLDELFIGDAGPAASKSQTRSRLERDRREEDGDFTDNRDMRQGSGLTILDSPNWAVFH